MAVLPPPPSRPRLGSGFRGRGSHFSTNLVGTLGIFCALAVTARAESPLPDTVSARSVSGQFVVYSARQTSRAPDLSKDARLLKLEPSLVTVSCERIKQALAGELGAIGPWRGKIYFSLYPAQSADDEITLIGERFKDNWAYRLDVPNPVERTRFARGVVQALLLEEANRHAGERSAEIPVWLVEGLVRRVLDAHRGEVLLPPPSLPKNGLRTSPLVVDAQRTNAFSLARLALGKRGPLSLEELSWPKQDQLAGPEAERYQVSAQLLVTELQRFEDGRACLRAMLGELPKFLNWQMAFLRAFQSHFQRQLDVEKWWALQVEFFTGRDASGLWSVEESWAKLDEILQAPVQMRREKKDLPSVAQVPLTTVIREWDLARQTPTLSAKLRELDGARLRVATNALPLVEDYRRTITDYLTKRGEVGQIYAGGKVPAPGANAVVREMLKKLEALEARRQEFKPQSTEPEAPGTAATVPVGPK